jgi:hypothetical protein
LGVEIEEKWLRMRTEMRANEDPAALKARFLGWMQGLHGYLTNVHAITRTPSAEVQEQWRSIVTIFANRFRSEVLAPTYSRQAHDILSDGDITAIVADVNAVASGLVGSLAADKEVLLDRAVASIPGGHPKSPTCGHPKLPHLG